MIKDLTIGEVARRAGLRSSAIRYYEQMGVLPLPRRMYGQRRYDLKVFQQVALIQTAQRAGFTVSEMQTLVAGFEVDTPPGVRWRALAQQKLVEIEKMISQAQEMKRLLEEGMRCQCLSLDECFPLQ